MIPVSYQLLLKRLKWRLGENKSNTVTDVQLRIMYLLTSQRRWVSSWLFKDYALLLDFHFPLTLLQLCSGDPLLHCELPHNTVPKDNNHFIMVCDSVGQDFSLGSAAGFCVPGVDWDYMVASIRRLFWSGPFWDGFCHTLGALAGWTAWRSSVGVPSMSSAWSFEEPPQCPSHVIFPAR